MDYMIELEKFKKQKQVLGAGAQGQFHNAIVAMLEHIIKLLEKR